MKVMKTEGCRFVGWEKWLELMIFRYNLVKLGARRRFILPFFRLTIRDGLNRRLDNINPLL